MSTVTWDQRAFQLATWLVVYLLILTIRSWFERWLVARFQNRRGDMRLIPPMVWTYKSALYTLVAIGGILAGALIPLAPQMQVGEQQLAFHLFGQADAGVLYALSALWMGAKLLAIAKAGSPADQTWVRHLADTTLLYALPVVLIALSLIVTSGAVNPRGEGTLHLSTLIGLQNRWAGFRWLGILQPLALGLWLVCTWELFQGAQTRATLAGQVLSLNVVLLTGALFLGGWQGPFVERWGWLGILYTLSKVLFLTFVHTWVAASTPRAALARRMQIVWRICTPLSALNLVVTAVVVALQQTGS
jgi:NADH-quinone oxidoreductase subunit H